jgi:hypothetical protein
MIRWHMRIDREVVEQRTLFDLSSPCALRSRKVHRLARHDVQAAPGVGPITALWLQGDDRRSDALQEIEKCWRLCRIDDTASCLRRGRLVRPNLKVR